MIFTGKSRCLGVCFFIRDANTDGYLSKFFRGACVYI